ncbi:S8 family peptidase [Lysinibacillus sphaericus]|uniref:S8 family peptidase n=1 Tax=Lysinibacillus sphaericus TaxID=1421 RepID=UPI0018CD115A|nr:S8 family peptidase [Lysinibacillus sphaericus]
MANNQNQGFRMKEALEGVLKNKKVKGTAFVIGLAVLGASLANQPYSLTNVKTTEVNVTEKTNIGDAELVDTQGVTYEMDKSKHFEVLVMYKNLEGLEFAEKVGKSVDGGDDLKIFNIIKIKTNDAGLKRLQNNKNILSAEINVRVEVEKQGSTMSSTSSKVYEVRPGEFASWAFEHMNIQEAYKKGVTGKGVKLAIADSGIAGHSDLKIVDQYIVNKNVLNLTDNNGHGTHVAGIVGASDNGSGAIGVASSVQMYSVKLDDDEGKLYASDMLDGLRWALENNVDIYNASFTNSLNSPIYQAAINAAYEKGLMIVAATGNEGEGTVGFPAAYDNVIAVGSIGSNGKLEYYSNYGPEVDFVAPGSVITSTSNKGDFETRSGTSMAVPFVSGVLALLMDEFPNQTPDWYYEALKDMSKDVEAQGFDNKSGYGLPQYKPSEIKEEVQENDKEITSVKDLPKNEQRIYELVMAYIKDPSGKPASKRTKDFERAEELVQLITPSVVRDQLLELLHEEGYAKDVALSTGSKYEEKLPQKIEELPYDERRYASQVERYIEKMKNAKREDLYEGYKETVTEIIKEKLTTSPVLDRLLAEAHKYGAALDVPYSNGSKYNGVVYEFSDLQKPSVVIPPTEIPQKPEEVIPPVTNVGKETSVSQLPKEQQEYYDRAEYYLNRVDSKNGESMLEQAVFYVSQINASPVRDRILAKVHQYGGLLHIPYSTGYSYQGLITKPWEKYNVPSKPDANTGGGSTNSGGSTNNGNGNAGGNTGGSTETPYDPPKEISDAYLDSVKKALDEDIASLRLRPDSHIAQMNFEADMLKIPAEYPEVTKYYRDLYNSIVSE